MQLKISTDYAIRIVLYLATTQTAATSAEISAQMGIPQTVIATLARPLQEAGILSTQRGSGGGSPSAAARRTSPSMRSSTLPRARPASTAVWSRTASVPGTARPTVPSTNFTPISRIIWTRHSSRKPSRPSWRTRNTPEREKERGSSCSEREPTHRRGNWRPMQPNTAPCWNGGLPPAAHGSICGWQRTRRSTRRDHPAQFAP